MYTSLLCPLCRSSNVTTTYQCLGGSSIQKQYGEYSIEFEQRKCLEKNCEYFCTKGKHFLSEDSKDWKAWDCPKPVFDYNVTPKTVSTLSITTEQLQELYSKAIPEDRALQINKEPKLPGGNF